MECCCRANACNGDNLYRSDPPTPTQQGPNSDNDDNPGAVSYLPQHLLKECLETALSSCQYPEPAEQSKGVLKTKKRNTCSESTSSVKAKSLSSPPHPIELVIYPCKNRSDSLYETDVSSLHTPTMDQSRDPQHSKLETFIDTCVRRAPSLDSHNDDVEDDLNTPSKVNTDPQRKTLLAGSFRSLVDNDTSTDDESNSDRSTSGNSRSSQKSMAPENHQRNTNGSGYFAKTSSKRDDTFRSHFTMSTTNSRSGDGYSSSRRSKSQKRSEKKAKSRHPSTPMDPVGDSPVQSLMPTALVAMPRRIISPPSVSKEDKSIAASRIMATSNIVSSPLHAERALDTGSNARDSLTNLKNSYGQRRTPITKQSIQLPSLATRISSTQSSGSSLEEIDLLPSDSPVSFSANRPARPLPGMSDIWKNHKAVGSENNVPETNPKGRKLIRHKLAHKEIQRQPAPAIVEGTNENVGSTSVETDLSDLPSGLSTINTDAEKTAKLLPNHRKSTIKSLHSVLMAELMMNVNVDELFADPVPNKGEDSIVKQIMEEPSEEEDTSIPALLNSTLQEDIQYITEKSATLKSKTTTVATELELSTSDRVADSCYSLRKRSIHWSILLLVLVIILCNLWVYYMHSVWKQRRAEELWRQRNQQSLDFNLKVLEFNSL